MSAHKLSIGNLNGAVTFFRAISQHSHVHMRCDMAVES